LSNKINLTVIILTYNEAVNISRAIANTINWASEVVVLDSFSDDNTIDIAESMGARIIQRKFDNYASQRNFALKEIEIKTEWVLFLDADEYLFEELKVEIAAALPNSTVDGYYLKRRFYFNGKWVKHGGYYPIWILRLFKKSKGTFMREINEHVALSGKTSKLIHDFADDNKKSLSFWWYKHIDYAQKEAKALLDLNNAPQHYHFWGSQADRKLWIRYKIWNKLPVYIRPFLYFIYRYIIRFGFLDGFIFHFFHGLVYYLMIDTFYLELKKKYKK
jgi:glycosyltransferase involved in cell wall biosynthesis